MTTLFAGVVADARANLHQKIILNLEFTVLLGSLFWLLKGYGLAGIAGAIGTGEVVRTFLYMRITHRDINIPYLRLLAIYKPGFFNAAAVGLGLMAVATAIRPLSLPPLLALLVLMAAGAVVLGVVVLRWPSTELRPMLQQATGKLRSLRALPASMQPGLARYTDFLDRRPGVLAAFDALEQPLVP
jgi:lipopolysaccharide exporter